MDINPVYGHHTSSRMDSRSDREDIQMEVAQEMAKQRGDTWRQHDCHIKRAPCKALGFWVKVFGGTVLSWFSRYLVVNALFLGFLPQDDQWQWVIFAREFVIWVVLMVSPTPGGSGLSEWLFSEYYGDIVPTAGMALMLAIMWRIISYYLYLGIGGGDSAGMAEEHGREIPQQGSKTVNTK